jgi:N-dimethylarginine dimethylaminohydrolase
VEGTLASHGALIVARREILDEKVRLGRLHVGRSSKGYADVGTRPAVHPVVSTRLVVSRLACHTSAHAHARGSACRYRIAWSINPHMRIGAANFERAEQQHDAFVTALREAGALVEPVAFVHGAYDSVFAKDSALLVEREGERRALLASPVHPVRQREQAGRARSLEALGFTLESARSPLEGGDVVMLPGARGALLGHGFRSSRAAARGLEAFLDAEVTPLELVDPHLYHLDVALSVLSDGTALVCEEAFTAAGLRSLRAHPAISSVVPVPRDEALRFGLNLVEVDGIAVLGSRAPTVEQALVARGSRIVHTPLQEFQLAGGSAACLVARLHSQDAAARRGRAAA